MENTLPPTLERGVAVLRKALETMPELPGVYRMVNVRGDVVYVGKAKNLKKRVPWYARVDQLPNRFRRMLAELMEVEITTTHTEVEALLLESNLIKRHKPRYNILLKDDKSFPYIVLTGDHPFPRVVKHRGPQTLKGDYFGPFASSEAVDEAILSLQRVFQIRNCSDHYFATRTRPCLQYHIKRCAAPCTAYISPAEYAENIKNAKRFLNGQTGFVQKILAQQMEAASAHLDFEKAAQYRDCIRLLTQIQARQRVNIGNVRDADIIVIAQAYGVTCVQIFFFRHGRHFGANHYCLDYGNESTLEERLSAFVPQFYSERAPAPCVLLSHTLEDLALISQALSQQYASKVTLEVPRRGMKKEVIDHALSNAYENAQRKATAAATNQAIFTEMKEIFGLADIPQRIEIYDNSHLQGNQPVGAMVVATPEGFDKKAYRKFNIKTPQGTGGDDYAMMREVMQRRFKVGQTMPPPDFMIIDGGAGQVSVVKAVFEELNITLPFVGMAKGPERNAGEERFFNPAGGPPLMLPKHSPLLHYLQRLRDEAHRYVIGTHRARREKLIHKSVLDGIPGIGPKRKKALLNYFGSAKAVASAGLSDLQLVPGVDAATAAHIYSFFHER
jgi:excinuclease ABC subunit C